MKGWISSKKKKREGKHPSGWTAACVALPIKEREGEEVSCLSAAPPPKKPQLKNKENGLFLTSHVKETWAALFEYHKQRCRAKGRVRGRALPHRALCPSTGHSGRWVPWHSHLHAPGRLRPGAILHITGHHSSAVLITAVSPTAWVWTVRVWTDKDFFFPNKYVPRYYTTCDWLRPPIQRAGYKVICRFPRVRRASAQTPVLFKSQL